MAAVSLCCPKCETILKMANRPTEGKKVKCPKCGAVFVADDHEVTKGSTAVKSTPDLPAVASPSKNRPKREDDEGNEPPRGRKSRADEDDQEDDEPRRAKAKRKRDDDDEDERPRRSIKKKQGGASGLLIGLCVGGGALVAVLALVGGLFFWLLSARPAVQVAQKVDAQPAVVVQPPPMVEKPVAKAAEVPVAKAAEVPVAKNPIAPPVKEPPVRQPKAKPKPPAKKPDPVPPPDPIPVAGPVDLDKDLLTKTSAATAYIRVDLGNQTSIGSGFLVKASGDSAYIITNFHVIAMEKEEPAPKKGGPKKGPGMPFPKQGGPKRVPFQGLPGFGGQPAAKQQPQPKEMARITVVLFSGTPQEQALPAQMVAFDEESDLAALRIIGARNLPRPIDVSLEAGSLFETQPVYIFGFPKNRAPAGPGNPPINVGKGTISGLRRDANDDLTDVHINGEINPGNSGGPVVDAQGRLVGIAVATVPGKRIGFAIPAGELSQMFKGRVSNALVLRLDQKGIRLDAHGEVWIHDRKNNVRGRDALSVRLPDVPKGSQVPADEYLILARLADPMLKLSAPTAYFSAVEQQPIKAGQGWAKMPNAVQLPLKVQDQIAIGTFKLPKGKIADQTYAFQFSYINADAKTVFTEPHLVRLTFPKKPLAVTLNITGIEDLPTRRYIENMMPTLFEGKFKIKSKTNDSLVVEIDLVADASVVEPKIKFGKVTSVEGRTFSIVANKIELPLPTAAEVSVSLEDVQSTDRKRRIAGADQLAKAYLPLPERRSEVTKALEANLADADLFVCKAALGALVIWGGPENISAVAAAGEKNIARAKCVEVLAKFKDPAAAAAVAKWLPNPLDRGKVSAVLKAMGPVAEKAVIPLLSHMDGFTAAEACHILKEIGTDECIPALTQAANSTNAFLSGAARTALKSVQAKSKGGR